MQKNLRLVWSFILGLAILCATSGAAFGQARDAELPFERGLAAYEQRHWGEALGFFDEAIKTDPGYAPAYHYRGGALIQLLQPEEAIKALEKARELAPKAADINLDLGAAYMKVGRLDDAESAFKREIASHPDNAEAFFSLGYLYLLKKDYKSALEPLAKAGKMDPELAVMAKFYEASALFALGRRDASRAAFNETLAMNPSQDVAEASRKYLASLKQAGAAPSKPWGIVAAVLYQFDTNVVAANRDTDFPISVNDKEISNKEDSRGVLTLYGYYRFVDNEDWLAEARYSFYQSFHADVDQFNLQNHAPELLGARDFTLFGKDARAGLKYSAGIAFLDTNLDMYSVNHWVTPSLWLGWSKTFATRFNARYNFEDFNDNDPNRDNNGYGIFVDNMLAFWGQKGLLTWTVGYDYEDGVDKSYDISRPYSRLQCGASLPLELSAQLSLYYEFEDHFNDDNNREDDVFSAEFLLFRPVWGPVEANINVNYRLNNSTEDAFEYERTIVGGGLVARF